MPVPHWRALEITAVYIISWFPGAPIIAMFDEWECFFVRDNSPVIRDWYLVVLIFLVNSA